MEFTHVANPVRVEAAVIVDVDITGPVPDCGVDVIVSLADGTQKDVHLSDEMVSRFIPGPGDYLVTQEDGYQYINPKAVFERKYRLVAPTFENSGAVLVDAFAERYAEVDKRKRTPEQIQIEELTQQLAAVKADAAQVSVYGMQDAERNVRHSVLLAMIPAGRSGLLKYVDEAVKYVMSGALPESK
jgi:hypothetical protein